MRRIAHNSLDACVYVPRFAFLSAAASPIRGPDDSCECRCSLAHELRLSVAILFHGCPINTGTIQRGGKR